MNHHSLLAISVLLLPVLGTGQQTQIANYDQSREQFFWSRLYDEGGETLYCGIGFVNRTGLTLEHVYPASWMAAARGCRNRDSCPDPFFHHAEADLHNLWPAHASINSSRSNVVYGKIPGETARRFTGFCPDFERTAAPDALVEPQDSVKGEIARSIFYMVFSYGFPMQGMESMLFDWHTADPVDAEECRRNEEIFLLQGTRNPFIGDCGNVVTLLPPPPVVGNRFRCGTKNTCGQMESCAEALFHFQQCGVTRLDGDNDGVPCESICR